MSMKAAIERVIDDLETEIEILAKQGVPSGFIAGKVDALTYAKCQLEAVIADA